MYENIQKLLLIPEWTDEIIWKLVLEHEPLIRHHARKLWKKFSYRGIEFDDMHQEGRIVTFWVIRKCRYRELVTAYVTCSVPGQMFDIAIASFREQGVALIGDIEKIVAAHERRSLDEMCDMRQMRFELEDMLKRVLKGEDLETALARLNGATQVELAAHYGVTQQAMAYRLKRIAKILAPYFEHFWRQLENKK